MKKRAFILCLALVLVFSISANVQAGDQPDVALWIHGDYVEGDVAPFIEEGRTQVPLRLISETLGYEVNWNDKDRSITIVKQDPKTQAFGGGVIFAVDQKQAIRLNTGLVNQAYRESIEGTLNADQAFDIVLKTASIIELDIAPRIYQDRTFVPIRAVAELFGEYVSWDNANRTVVVGYNYGQTEAAGDQWNDKLEGVFKILQQTFDEEGAISYEDGKQNFRIYPLSAYQQFFAYINRGEDLGPDYRKSWGQAVEDIRVISEQIDQLIGPGYSLSVANPSQPKDQLILAKGGRVYHDALAELLAED